MPHHITKDSVSNIDHTAISYIDLVDINNLLVVVKRHILKELSSSILGDIFDSINSIEASYFLTRKLLINN